MQMTFFNYLTLCNLDIVSATEGAVSTCPKILTLYNSQTDWLASVITSRPFHSGQSIITILETAKQHQWVYAHRALLSRVALSYTDLRIFLDTSVSYLRPR
jgi:hypothetical protein